MGTAGLFQPGQELHQACPQKSMISSCSRSHNNSEQLHSSCLGTSTRRKHLRASGSIQLSSTAPDVLMHQIILSPLHPPHLHLMQTSNSCSPLDSPQRPLCSSLLGVLLLYSSFALEIFCTLRNHKTGRRPLRHMTPSPPPSFSTARKMNPENVRDLMDQSDECVTVLLLLTPPVSDIAGVRRCRGSGPEPAGPAGLPAHSVLLLLPGHRRGHQEARGLLRYLGRRGQRAHPLVSGRGRDQALIQNPSGLSGGDLVVFDLSCSILPPHSQRNPFFPFQRASPK